MVGAGYIAVELAGILNSLGCETHLLIRRDHVLRNFDETVSRLLTEEIVNSGIKLHRQTQVRVYHTGKLRCMCGQTRVWVDAGICASHG